MTAKEALLAPARTRGFSLSEKAFVFFLVDRVNEVDYRKKPANLSCWSRI